MSLVNSAARAQARGANGFGAECGAPPQFALPCLPDLCSYYSPFRQRHISRAANPSPIVRYTTRIIVPPRVKRSSLPGGYGSKPKAQVLGVRKTFGFGDRLGAAADIHVTVASAHPEFAPVFAQQSGLELANAGRTIQQVITAAMRGVDHARFRPPWGADADQLRTPQEVENAAAAGFSYFTVDPSEWIASGADDMAPAEVVAMLDRLMADGDLPDDWFEPYLNRTIDLPGNQRLQLTLDPLQRAAAKYGAAIRHCARMAETAARACHGRAYELEVMFGRNGPATTPLEHLFVGLELEARGVRMVSAGLHFGLEPAGDYEGDLAQFEKRLREHAAVAEFCGPHKLSFHEASDKAAIYPLISRCCGDAVHLKTSGLSFLAALRVVARVEPELFAEIVHWAREFFQVDSIGAGISTTPGEVRALPGFDAAEAERLYLDDRVGRQMLHATFGSIVTRGYDSRGRSFRDRTLELLERHADIYREVLGIRLEEMFRLLAAG